MTNSINNVIISLQKGDYNVWERKRENNMEKEKNLSMELLKNEFETTREHEEDTNNSKDNSISKVALIAYLFS